MTSREHEAQIVMTLTPYLVAFPQSRMTAEGLVVYAKALASLSVAEVNAAMLKLMRTARFWPTVAEIFEQAEAMRAFAAGSELPTADEAWGEAMRECHEKFTYGKWDFSCPEVEQAVKRFGKMELCLLEPEGMNTARAQFMRIYESVKNRAREKATNRAVLDALPERQAEMLASGLAEKKALTAAR